MTATTQRPVGAAPGSLALDPHRVAGLLGHAVAGGSPFEVVTPMTGEVVATLAASTTTDVQDAYATARAAQPAWASTAIAERAAILWDYHDRVLSGQSQLLDVVQLESGKARVQAFEEVADVAIVARHYARTAARSLRPRRRAGLYPILSQSVEARVPKGVVGIVSPWNYPLSLSITDTLPALMAGNAVVLRPDPQGSLTALLAVELLRAAGLPREVLQVVLGDGPSIGAAVLELGGKNALYVAADADLSRTVPGAIRSCFSAAGQLCISTERVLVHESVYDAFVPRFVAAARELRMGTGLRYGYDLGSLVSAAQLERVTAHVEDARAKGAAVLAGGRARPDIGPFAYEATILDGVSAQMLCRDEETFGPVVALYRVASDAAAIALANDTAYGLNASIWTRDIARGRAIASQIRTGTVNINEGYAAAWGSVAAPMGGMKASGIGRRHGVEGIVRFTESQNVTAQRGLPVAPALGLSDERFATVLTGALRVLKAVGRS